MDGVCEEVGREDRGARLQGGYDYFGRAPHSDKCDKTAVEKNLKERNEKEDKMTTNKYETLHSQVARLSEEHNGSAASTVLASSGCGGSNFAASVMPNTFIPTLCGLEFR